MTLTCPTRRRRMPATVLAAAAVLAVTTFAWSDPAGAQDAETVDLDRVVATVDGVDIRERDIGAFTDQLPPRMRAMPAEALRPLILQQLIDMKLVAAAARAGDVGDDPLITARIEQAGERVLQDAYLSGLLADEITEERLRARYDAQYAEGGGEEEVRAQHILVETEEEAEEIILALDGGADFSDLARERSTGPSGPGGGDLGFFTSERMVPPFSQAAFALKVGEHTTAPVQTQFGWHVIKVTDRRTQEPPPFEEVSGSLAEELARSLVSEEIDRLRAAATIEELDAPAGDSE